MKTGIIAMVAIVTLGACTKGPARDGADVLGVSMDSLTLERSVCFGFCPAYRLSLTGAGRLRFEPRPPAKDTSVSTDSIPPSEVSSLLARADSAGFFAFPDTVRSDSTLCQNLATDHSTATVTIFRAAGSKHVVDYLGCNALSDSSVALKLSRLRAFEDAIDSVTRSTRWTKSAQVR